MANRPIIDIAVKDDAFKAFLEKYQAFQEQVRDLPGTWGQFTEGTHASSNSFIEMTEALISQKLLMSELAKAQKLQAKNEQDALNVDKKRRVELRAMWDDTKGMARTVAGITADLFRWVGVGSIVSGLAGAGGLWGLDQLANRVSDQRRSAQGLGVSVGQQQALGINFSPYMDVNGVLGSIAEAKADRSKWAYFNMLGINRSQDPATLAAQLAGKASTLYNSGHNTAQDPLVQAMGAMGFSLEDMRRLGSLKKDELANAEHQYALDAKSLSRSDAVSQQWQRMSVQMHRAGQEIENAFIIGLEPLVKEFPQLSDAVVDAIKIFMQSGALKKLIPELADGIRAAAVYLSSPKFQNDMRTFATDVGLVAEKLVAALKFLGVIPDVAPPGVMSPKDAPVGGDTTSPKGYYTHDIFGNPHYHKPDTPMFQGLYDWLGGKGEGKVAGKGAGVAPSANVQRREMGAMRAFIGMGWEPEKAAGIVANLNAESAMNPFAHGDNNEAYGIGQWHKNRRDNYAKVFGHSMESVKDPIMALREQLQFVQWELQHTHGLANSYLKGAMGAEQSGAVVSKYYEAPKDVMGEQHKRAGDAKIVLHLYNKTGAAVAVQGAQVAQ